MVVHLDSIGPVEFSKSFLSQGFREGQEATTTAPSISHLTPNQSGDDSDNQEQSEPKAKRSRRDKSPLTHAAGSAYPHTSGAMYRPMHMGADGYPQAFMYPGMQMPAGMGMPYGHPAQFHRGLPPGMVPHPHFPMYPIPPGMAIGNIPGQPSGMMAHPHAAMMQAGRLPMSPPSTPSTGSPVFGESAMRYHGMHLHPAHAHAQALAHQRAYAQQQGEDDSQDDSEDDDEDDESGSPKLAASATRRKSTSDGTKANGGDGDEATSHRHSSGSARGGCPMGYGAGAAKEATMNAQRGGSDSLMDILAIAAAAVADDKAKAKRIIANSSSTNTTTSTDTKPSSATALQQTSAAASVSLESAVDAGEDIKTEA